MGTVTGKHWPIPFPSRSVHLVGDIQAISAPRKTVVLEDMSRQAIPQVPYRFQVGDFIGTGPDSWYIAAKAFMNAFGTVPWYACIGNHDYDGRTPAEAAALIGTPGGAINYVVDIGHSVVIVFFERAEGGLSMPAPDLDWLDEQLTTYSDRIVFVMAHPPLFDVRPPYENSIAPDGPAIAAVLAEHVCCKGWLCGHTHDDINDPDICNVISVGGRQIAQINGSATYYTANKPDGENDVNFTDKVATTWVTMHDDKVEVRFRDHGAHQWVGGGEFNERVWTFDYQD